MRRFLPPLLASLLLLGIALPAQATTDREAKRQLMGKLKSITISQMAYEEARVGDVLLHLRDRIRDLDIGAETPFNMVVRAENDVLDSRITLDLTNIPAGEALRYVCIVANMNYRIESRAVIVYDNEEQAEQMETRVFHIDPSLLGTPTTRAKHEFNKE